MPEHGFSFAIMNHMVAIVGFSKTMLSRQEMVQENELSIFILFNCSSAY